MSGLDDDFGEPADLSHEDIRVRRLEIAIEKLHRMPASQIRDGLVADIESLICRILNQASAHGLQGGRRR